MMSKNRVLELLPFFALIAVVAILSSTVLASATFTIPNLRDRFSFGSGTSAYAPGTTTTVQKGYLPLSDLAIQSGISMPFGGFSMFNTPVTSTRSYTRTITMPDGPVTQTVNQAYDGLTGERTTTVTNL